MLRAHFSTLFFCLSVLTGTPEAFAASQPADALQLIMTTVHRKNAQKIDEWTDTLSASYQEFLVRFPYGKFCRSHAGYLKKCEQFQQQELAALKKGEWHRLFYAEDVAFNSEDDSLASYILMREEFPVDSSRACAIGLEMHLDLDEKVLLNVEFNDHCE